MDSTKVILSMKTEKRNKTHEEAEAATVVDGFSSRYNELLDLAGFPEVGRLTKVARYFGVSVSGVRRWCKLDKPPRIRALVTNVESVISLSSTKLDSQTIVNWLLYGEDTPIPSGEVSTGAAKQRSTRSAQSAQVNALNDHMVMSQIYMTLNAEAKKLKIDLYGKQTLPNDVLDSIIHRLAEYVEKNEIAPDSIQLCSDFQRLASSLLLVTKDSYL